MLTTASSLSLAYWRSAALELKNLRRLIFAALVVAMGIVISSLFIPVGDNLRIYFKFLVYSVGSAVYGPFLGLLVGAVGDTLGYFIHPSGAYFPGYLLSEMLGCLVYALLLYRKRITVLRLFLSKLIVNVCINLCLGSLWSAMLYSKGFYYYFAKSAVKNLLLLPLEVLAMTALFALLIPQLERMNALPRRPENQKRIVPFF
ncbi:MAG: folate family ECF transporter S component [Oscillospiraceae bacterium]|nr:folate family ECF transporter S component [Oscillospiraceae bacterium]